MNFWAGGGRCRVADEPRPAAGRRARAPAGRRGRRRPRAPCALRHRDDRSGPPTNPEPSTRRRHQRDMGRWPRRGGSSIRAGPGPSRPYSPVGRRAANHLAPAVRLCRGSSVEDRHDRLIEIGTRGGRIPDSYPVDPPLTADGSRAAGPSAPKPASRQDRSGMTGAHLGSAQNDEAADAGSHGRPQVGPEPSVSRLRWPTDRQERIDTSRTHPRPAAIEEGARCAEHRETASQIGAARPPAPCPTARWDPIGGTRAGPATPRTKKRPDARSIGPPLSRGSIMRSELPFDPDEANPGVRRAVALGLEVHVLVFDFAAD